MLRLTVTLLLLSPFASAQQSLFNVPSGEVTTAKKVFFQEQIGFSGRQAQFNTVTCLGLGHVFEIGLDLMNLDVNFHSGPFIDTNDTGMDEPLSPLAMATALYGREIREWWHAAAGVQLGTNVLARWANKGAVFAYLNNRFELPWLDARLYAGAYWGNPAILGGANAQANFMLGLEIPIRHGNSKRLFK